MRIPALFILPIIASFAACMPVPPKCSDINRTEIRRIDALIVEQQATIKRGYTKVQPTRSGGVEVCLGGGGTNVGISFCTPGAATRRAAIDPVVEARKLEALRTKRAQLISEADPAVSRCQGPAR